MDVKISSFHIHAMHCFGCAEEEKTGLASHSWMTRLGVLTDGAHKSDIFNSLTKKDLHSPEPFGKKRLQVNAR